MSVKGRVSDDALVISSYRRFDVRWVRRPLAQRRHRRFELGLGFFVSARVFEVPNSVIKAIGKPRLDVRKGINVERVV